VEPRITAGVTVTVGRELGDVYALAVGAHERYFRDRLELPQHIVAGRWFTGAPDELIVGSKVAAQSGAKVGDELLLLGATQDGSLSPIKGRVVGIAKSGTALLNQQIFVPLEKMQWLADIPAGATELLVYGGSYTQAVRLGKQLSAVPGLHGYAVQAWSEREPWHSLAGALKGSESVIVLVIVFLAALGIWNTLMMSVLERTHEIGVLRAMGLSRLGVVWLFVTEALAMALAGGAVGLALGSVPALLLQHYGLRVGEKTVSNMNMPYSEVVHAHLTPDILVTGFGLGLLMALLGSVIPAVRAASIQPVSAMRSGG
jgi:putative ABC transport system permease protein